MNTSTRKETRPSAWPRWGGIALPASVLWLTALGAGTGLLLGNVAIGAAIGAALGVGIGMFLLAAAFVKASRHW